MTSDRKTAHLSRAISDHLPMDDDLVQEPSHGESSDEEWNRAMEVVFDPNNARRRKSSIVLSEVPSISPHSSEGRSSSQCLVHHIVEKTHRQKYSPPEKQFQLGMIDENGSAAPCEEPRATHSRLLTKKQLNEMATSVRALAKKLSTIKVKLNIRTVFLLNKLHDQTLIAKTREVVRWLLSRVQATQYVVYVEDTMRHNKIFNAEDLIAENPSYPSRLKYWTNELARKRPHTFDFVLSLGGDGTVLYASWLFQRVVPPVLSFALGSLGFLTKFDFHDYQDILTRAFTDGVTISLRLRLEGTIMRCQNRPTTGEHRDIVEELIGEEGDDHRTHKSDRSFEVLNEIVVDRGPNPTMSTIELFGDEEHLTTVQADGICVATPTGSTAYNLAAGGSLCHPENPVILVTAICAHTLSFRPVILPDTMVLRVAVPYDARTSSWASFDGRERVELYPGDYVTISASRYPFANVMPPGRRSEDWINSISRTLQWNSRQRQKAFQE